MSRVVFLCVFAVLILSSVAQASDERRHFGLYLGGGLTRSFASATQPGVDAKLQGWSNAGEIGLDIPFSNRFGTSIGIELSQDDLTNQFKSDSYIEKTTLNSRGVKAGFYYRQFALGGGYRQTKLDIKAVSSGSSASSVALDGNATFAFASFNIDYKELLRMSIEAQGQNFEASNLKYSDLQIGLRLYFLFSGLIR